MILKAEKVTRQFNRISGNSNVFYAVHETDFELPGGLLTVLEGRSGSGKTTFLNMLSGLLRPSSGNIYLDGTDIYSQTDKELSRFRNDNYGIVPQGQSAIATLTVMENVMLPGTIYGQDEGLHEKAEKLLDRMGILELADVLPKELSGGEAETTNNRMEMTAVITALSALKEKCEVTLYSDSKYIIDSVTKGWARSWKANGWKKGDKKPALNPDLWEKLLDLLDKHVVTFVWVKGHAGHPENERCDSLAVAQSKRF